MAGKQFLTICFHQNPTRDCGVRYGVRFERQLSSIWNIRPTREVKYTSRKDPGGGSKNRLCMHWRCDFMDNTPPVAGSCRCVVNVTHYVTCVNCLRSTPPPNMSTKQSFVDMHTLLEARVRQSACFPRRYPCDTRSKTKALRPLFNRLRQSQPRPSREIYQKGVSILFQPHAHFSRSPEKVTDALDNCLPMRYTTHSCCPSV